MLTVTASAADAVRRLMSSARASAEPHAGVRISSDAPPVAGMPLAVAMVDAPRTTDQTIEQDGAVVFVDATTAELLEDEVLDVDVGAAGVRFTIRELRDALADPHFNAASNSTVTSSASARRGKWTSRPPSTVTPGSRSFARRALID